MRGDDFYIDTFFGSEGESVHDFAVADEVWGGDAKGLGGAIDEVEIDVFGDRLVIDGGGTGAIDDSEAGSFGKF